MDQQVEQEADEIESGVSDSSFDSGEEPQDEFDPDYDPSRDRWVVSGLHLSWLHFEPFMYIYGMVGLDNCILCSI